MSVLSRMTGFPSNPNEQPDPLETLTLPYHKTHLWGSQLGETQRVREVEYSCESRNRVEGIGFDAWWYMNIRPVNRHHI